MDKTYTNNKDLVLYTGGESLTTLLTDCLKCIYTLKQYKVGDKNIMPFSEAMEKMTEYENKKYIKPWKKTTEEEFDEMLGVLPPMVWENIKGVNIFGMSEFMTSNITAYYIEFEGKYYKSYRRVKKIELIVEEFLDQIKKIEKTNGKY